MARLNVSAYILRFASLSLVFSSLALEGCKSMTAANPSVQTNTTAQGQSNPNSQVNPGATATPAPVATPTPPAATATPIPTATPTPSLPAGSGAMLSGSGAPANSLGVNGDLYHRTDTPSVYGPKVNGAWPATYSMILGKGCTTAYHIDADCDGYGTGTDANDPNPIIGADADDSDPTVNTNATVISKYSNVINFLKSVKGYNPVNIWYLSATGIDSPSCKNNVAAPCATWNYVVGAMGAGDLILVRGSGAINQDANYGCLHAGSSAQPTVAMSYPGELGILDHASNYGWYGPQCGGVSYITFDGLKISNSGNSGLGIGLQLTSPGGGVTGDYVTVVNMDISGYYRDIWGTGTNNALIQNNVIYNATAEHNIYLGSNSDTGPTANLVVRGNILYNAAWDNFHFNGLCDSCLLDSNIMYAANTSAGGTANITLQEGWNHSTVSNNVVFNAASWALTLNDYDDPQAPFILPYNQNYNLFINNTFIHTGFTNTGINLTSQNMPVVGVIQGSATAGLDLGHNTWANNIFLEGATGTTTDSVVLYEWNNSGDTNFLTTDTWASNILSASNGSPPIKTGLSSNIVTQNWNYFQSTAGSFTNNTQGDPLLTAWNPAWYASPNLFNLMPLSGSSAIGTGAMITGSPALNIQGIARSNPPNRGAY